MVVATGLAVLEQALGHADGADGLEQGHDRRRADDDLPRAVAKTISAIRPTGSRTMASRMPSTKIKTDEMPEPHREITPVRRSPTSDCDFAVTLSGGALQ